MRKISPKQQQIISSLEGQGIVSQAGEGGVGDTIAWTSVTGKPSTFSPQAHASSHGVGQPDAITVAQSQVTGLETELGDLQSQITTNTGDISTLETTVSSLGGSYESADADAFETRVIAAGSTLTDIEYEAVGVLISDLKATTIWNKMIAVYPFVGRTAASHALNLIGLSNSISWGLGTIVHDTKGSEVFLASNSNGLFGIDPAVDLTAQNFSWGGYVAEFTSTTSGRHVFGGGYTPTGDTNRFYLSVGSSGTTLDYGIGSFFGTYSLRGYAAGFVALTQRAANSLAFYCRNRIAATSSSTVTGGRQTGNMGINPLVASPGDFVVSFAFVGQGLSDSELQSFRDIVEKFQIKLSRNI